jgi:hypothetical protein
LLSVCSTRKSKKKFSFGQEYNINYGNDHAAGASVHLRRCAIINNVRVLYLSSGACILLAGGSGGSGGHARACKPGRRALNAVAATISRKKNWPCQMLFVILHSQQLVAANRLVEGGKTQGLT